MQIYNYPPREQWAEILARPVFDNSKLFSVVEGVLTDVKQNGDKAVRAYTAKFDKVSIDRLEVTADEIAEAETLVSKQLKQAIEMARRNIWKFHVEQQHDLPEIQTSA